MKNRLTYIFLFCCFVAGLQAQPDTLKTSLIKFLIEKKDLISDYKSFNTNVLIVNDILTLEKPEKEDYGIFKFGTLSSHSYFHILLKDKNKYKILDMRQPLENVVLQVVSYFKEEEFYDRDLVLAYLDKVIELYKRNMQAVPWKENG